MRARLLRLRKALTRYSLIWLLRFIRLFACSIPYTAGVWAGGVLGSFAYYALLRERKRTINHLTRVFGNKSSQWIARTARNCFKHLGKSLLEVMLMTPRRAAEIVDFAGENCIKDALSRGRGVIVVTGHIGNWELMGHAAAARNYPMSVIAAPLEPEQINDMIVGLRARLGVRTILRSRPGAAKELIRVFKENRLLGLLIDQDTDVDGAFVDFMGFPAWTPTAAASMAVKFDAPVLFATIMRRGNNRHVATVEGPLELVKSGNAEQDVLINTAMFTKKLETCIRACPEQWVWMHRRWRRQP
jgi:Kdo2-lipid IVA lauroyltransferase/acyltransferase